MREAIIELESKKVQKDGLTGVPSGFTALIGFTSGWQKSEFGLYMQPHGSSRCG